MRYLAFALVLACGSPPPVPRHVAAPAAKPAPTIAPVSCGDAGVILRGAVEDDKRAGPEKEAVIARACLRGRWTPDVLACVGTSREPTACLEQLSAEQTTKYHALLAAWNELFPDEQVAELDKAEPQLDPDDVPSIVDCVTATANVEHLVPALGQQGADRRFAVEARRDAVEPICEDWSTTARVCFASASSADLDLCRSTLAPDQAKVLADKLAATDRVLARIASLRARPAAVDCAKVAAAHYSEAEWTARGPAGTPKTTVVRRKLIAESRTVMRRACTSERWPVDVRACLVAGGRDLCFGTLPQVYSRFGFPAAGVIVKTGIPTCEAYAATLRKLRSCTRMPQRSIDSMEAQFAREAASYALGTPAVRATGATRCKESDEAIRRAVQAFNCTI